MWRSHRSHFPKQLCANRMCDNDGHLMSCRWLWWWDKVQTSAIHSDSYLLRGVPQKVHVSTCLQSWSLYLELKFNLIKTLTFQTTNVLGTLSLAPTVMKVHSREPWCDGCFWPVFPQSCSLDRPRLSMAWWTFISSASVEVISLDSSCVQLFLCLHQHLQFPWSRSDHNWEVLDWTWMVS